MDASFYHDDIGLITRNSYIHTPSDTAKRSLFYLQETGMLRANSLHRSNRKDLDSYLFFIVQDGAGFLECSGTVTELFEGDCVFVDCHQAYAHFTYNDFWTLQWVHFNGPNMEEIYREYLSCGGQICFRSSNFGRYREILKQIQGLKKQEMHLFVKDINIHGKLSELFVLLMQDTCMSKKKRRVFGKMPEIQNVKAYLDHNYANKLSLDELSRNFYIDKYYMSKVFEERYGYTINSYLIRLRIDEGKRLLRFTDKKIEEIGVLCGMGGGNYFSRVFKKIEGISPGKYRRLWKEK